MTSDAQRAHMARIMDALAFYNRRVHYAQIRPMRTSSIRHLRAALLRPGGITMDCSEGVTFVCRLAGLRDPNGLHYNGAGNTDTLSTYLTHYSDPAMARTGALCLFGLEHVAMVRRPGRDPLLWTHGTEADPSFHPLSWMRPGFPGLPVTFLSIAKLGT